MIKETFNDAIRMLQTAEHKEAGEIALFRQLALDLSTRNGVRSTFVQETHGNRGRVEFDSLITNSPKCVEIADLLIINCNKEQKEVRICFLQAKYNKAKHTISISGGNSALQFELLRRRCRIEDTHKYGFQNTILNFTSYKTITAYGIFYSEGIKGYEFIFSIPENFYIQGIPKEGAAIRAAFNNFEPETALLYDCSLLRYNSPTTIEKSKPCCRKENLFLGSFDSFENALIGGKIGAPVNTSETPNNIKQCLVGILSSMKGSDASNNSIVNDISKAIYETNYNDPDTREYNYMNTLLIISDAKDKQNQVGA